MTEHKPLYGMSDQHLREIMRQEIEVPLWVLYLIFFLIGFFLGGTIL